MSTEKIILQERETLPENHSYNQGWYNDWVNKTWNGTEWVVADQSDCIPEEKIPVTIARKSDLMNILRNLPADALPEIRPDAYWQEYINSLVNTKLDSDEFTTYRDALDAVISEILSRLSVVDPGGEGVQYLVWTVYKTVNTYDEVPAVPSGGIWDSVNNTLTPPSGWSTSVPIVGQGFHWSSYGTFRSDTGALVGAWSYPIRYGQEVTVSSTDKYYLATNDSEAPALDTLGWTTDYRSAVQSWGSDNPYLWSYVSVSYSNNQNISFGPYLLRTYNAQLEVVYEEIMEDVNQLVQEDLEDVVARLQSIESSYANININSEDSLIELITQHAWSDDSRYNSFADLIVDGSKISVLAGALDENGKLTEAGITTSAFDGIISQAIQQVEGVIDAAVQNINPLDINMTVMKSTAYWKSVDGDTSKDEDYDAFKIEFNTYWETEHPEETATVVDYQTWVEETKVDGDSNPLYTFTTAVSEMSTIKQTSNEVLAMVGDGNGHAAGYIQLLAENNPDPEGGVLSHITLSANYITLDGQVLANAIEAQELNIGGSAVIADSTGITVTNAKIIGGSYANYGFFGTFTVDDETKVVTPVSGVSIDSTGLCSSNHDDNQHINDGFRLTAGNDSIISGWHLGSGLFYSGAGSSYVGLSSSTNNNYAFWAGNSTAAEAPFSVTRNGGFYATNANITGIIHANSGTIDGLLTMGNNGAITVSKSGNENKYGWTRTTTISAEGLVQTRTVTNYYGTPSATELSSGYIHTFNPDTYAGISITSTSIERFDGNAIYTYPLWTSMGGGWSVEVVSSLPALPDSYTLYFVTD